MLPNWLLHPEGYSILAACGPHQLARELEFDDGTKRGALSYLLFRSLAELQDPNPRQQDLYHYLCSLFHSHCPRQDPVLYGNQDLQFFGPLAAAHHHNYDATPVWLAKNTLLSDRIALQAGRAHGVCIGDLLLAYPTWQAGGAGMAAAAAADNKELLLRVTEIGGLTAVAEVATSRAGQAVIDLGDGGWKAKWQTKLSLRRYPILVSGSHALLGRWRAEAASQNSLNIRYDDDDGVDDAFQFHVVLDDLGHWEIRDGLREAVAQGTTETASSAAAAASGDGIGDILDALEHLVWFKHVISINNESPSIHFQKSLSITLTTPLGKTLDPGAGLIEVRDGDRVVLGVENLGSGPLYLHVYNMDSSWQVNNILKGTYEAIPARDPDGNHLGATTRVMNMTMPAEATSKGKKRFCDDIVKVFVTARPTSFACLEMPKLGAAVKADAQAGIPAGVAQGSGMAEGSAWTVVNFRFRINAR
ncbi:hypothetical protein QBC43DRAFT_324184 [Cladorrhinum sp. PSN259]|nr:hypothetical protein QBC43DRAFT_324184 [Cladorrhinum sp. PSN259]